MLYRGKVWMTVTSRPARRAWMVRFPFGWYDTVLILEWDTDRDVRIDQYPMSHVWQEAI